MTITAAASAWVRPVLGMPEAPVMVICDPQTRDAAVSRRPMGVNAFNLLCRYFEQAGIPRGMIQFVALCPPIPEAAASSAKRQWDFISAHLDGIQDLIRDRQPKVIIPIGSHAVRAVMGKAQAITKVRGMAQDLDGLLVFPMLSPGHVLKVPENEPTFRTDFYTLKKIIDAGFKADAVRGRETQYEWRDDISDLIESRPKFLAVDTEFVGGLQWYRPQVQPITVQLCPAPGKTLIVPVHPEYRRRWGLFDPSMRSIAKVKNQLRTLLEDPSIPKVGHNFKIDHHVLRQDGIDVKGWAHDTLLLAFAVDENMQSKSLDDCIKRWVPEMAGYADCVSPDALVLTADMRKVRAGDLKVGDELCAFTAETDGKKAQRRSMAKSIVLATQRIVRPCLKITTASGRVTVVSEGHLMLCKRGLGDKGGGWRWRRADSLTVGSVLKPFPWHDPVGTYDAGYASGLLDGEGWICTGRSRAGMAQRPGPVLEKFREIVAREGVVAGHNTDSRKKVGVVNVTFDGPECFSLLQKFRPQRLIEEARWEGCGLPTNGMRHDPVVAIEPVGEQEVIGLQTSTQTIIADGLLSHNSFNAQKGVKERMMEVPPEDVVDAFGNVVQYGLRSYAGGDPDAVFRLAKVLVPLLREDPAQYNCYRRVMIPGITAFARTVERVGQCIDRDYLCQLEREIREWTETEYDRLIKMVPPAVRQKHIDMGKECSFTRDDFMRDVLFSDLGFKLKPRMFTNTTAHLPDGHPDKLPSVSTKDHMPYFEDARGKAGEFVRGYIQYQKAMKLLSTYIGEEANGTGFWKYISDEGRIHPSYALHKTNTGRCLPASEIVITNFGPMTMGEIGRRWAERGRQANLFVVTHDERLRPITDFVDNGVRQTWTIQTENGAQVTATANHPIWTERGWINMEDLREGDTVYTGDYELHLPLSEEWKPYRDTGYEVSSLGRVRRIGSERCVLPRAKGRWGHVKVSLGRSLKDQPVHRLVCEAFNGPAPEGKPECRHLNGLPADNRPENLVWGTRAENAADGTLLGRYKRNGSHRLTDVQASEIVRRFEAGEHYKDLAVEFAIHETYVHMLVRKDRRSSVRRHTLSRIIFKVQDKTQRTFDISVEEDHSFVAGNVVVHNTASSDPNGQNIPKRGDFAKTYRKSFKASPGFRRIDADLSQIELRLIAWMANEPEMIRIYREDGDIHTETAMATSRMGHNEWATLDEDQIDDLRRKAKAVNFGFVYGMQWRGFKVYAKTQYGVDYSDREAQETRGLFFTKYRGLIPWHERMKEEARRNGMVRALHGARRLLPSMFSEDEAMIAMAERQAVNAPIQRFGSDLGVIAMSILERHADPDIVRPIGFIHDCLACEAREGYEEDAARAIRWIMENVPLKRYFGIEPPIPIKADAEVENAEGKMVKRKDLTPEVPWFWKDEVEEDFEAFMTATGCNAFERFEPLADRIPVLF